MRNIGIINGLMWLQADTESLKAAICSAVDVMQAMGTSICSLLSRVRYDILSYCNDHAVYIISLAFPCFAFGCLFMGTWTRRSFPGS